MWTSFRRELAEKYRSEPTDAILGGRLGTYRYLDMDQTVAQALDAVEGEFV